MIKLKAISREHQAYGERGCDNFHSLENVVGVGLAL